MENFLLSLNVVLPLFLEMALGYAIRCFRLVDEPTLRKMNNVVFRVFLPILLFYNVISTDIGTAFNGPLMLTAVLFVLGEFALCMALVPLLEKENSRRGVLIQGITIYAGGGEAEAQAALARVDECAALLSAHRQGSDIVFLNGADADENVLVSPLTADVLRAGLEIGEKTGGALDITLYAVSQLWDYKSENPQVPDEAAVRAALEKSGRGRVCVEGNSVCTGGTQLDLGAIAKGAVGDEVMACLKEQGVICALVNLGGNILTLGEKADGSPWTIAVASPFGEGYAGRIEVGGGKAVATSSGAQRYFEKDGVVYHHILDPETGYPARSGLASVTVIADDGLTADALSTALFVAGEAQAARILEEQYPNVGAVLIRDDGSIRILGDVCFTEEAGA